MDKSLQPQMQDFGWLTGGGEMGKRIRSFDWSKTQLGPVSAWPQSLKTAIRIMLDSRYPMFVWWGPKLIQIYNDAYIPILGKRHPDGLGRPAAEVWSDVWPVVGPQTEAVLNEGQSTWNEETLLIMERNQFVEEAYFTFSYSPAPDDEGGIGGVFCAVTEETRRVLSQRRLRTLQALGEQAVQVKTVEGACEAAAATLAENQHDLPFVLLYLLDSDGRRARLTGSTKLEPGAPASPLVVDLEDNDAPWPFRQVSETQNGVEVDDLPRKFGPLPGGVWPESPEKAIVLSIVKPGQSQPAGFVVAGVSPRLDFNDEYRAFMDLMAGHVATAVANAQAHETERKRAEALAELDRAKTAFFSNVSHEFRTPLTLMLGPVEDMLAKSGNGLAPSERDQLEVVHRNSLRLLKLVNTMRDFSRIESGRIQANYEPVDLAAYTSDLASAFRSAIEHAGMKLTVNCPPLHEPVYVDRDMWEKIVLNLLSNAFKFTLEGEIEVRLEAGDRQVCLTVCDTGVGIPEEEMPRIFERFHRVRDSRGRTFEGTGIGLALVQELVKLHGGAVRAESVLNEGSRFIVTVPLGKAHLDPERVSKQSSRTPTNTGAEAFVQEAMRWIPGAEGAAEEQIWREPVTTVASHPGKTGEHSHSTQRARIVWADDNADMRDYVSRLLGDQFEVEAVADGQTALNAVRANPPDLVLSDAMMPGLDGFALLKAIRENPKLQQIPVILLSARAGEEARIEGMEAGADDYLIKPFSARELLARVEAQVRMARVRREAEAAVRESEEQLSAIFHQATTGVAQMDLTGRFVLVNERYCEIVGRPVDELLGLRMQDITHPEDLPRNLALFESLIADGTTFNLDKRYIRPDGSTVWVNNSVSAIRSPDGTVRHVITVMLDITEQKQTQEALERVIAESERQRRLYDTVISSTPDLIYTFDLNYHFTFANDALLRMWGRTLEDSIGKSLLEVGYEPWHAEMHEREIDQVIATKQPIRGEVPFQHAELGRRIYDYILVPVLNAEGKVEAIAGTTRDVTDIKQIEEALRESETRFREMIDALPAAVYTTDAAGKLTHFNPASVEFSGRTPEIGSDEWCVTWKLYHPDGTPMPHDTCPMAVALKEGRAVRGAEAIAERPDGTRIWFQPYPTPLRDKDGNVVGGINMLVDITERKREERDIQSLLQISQRLSSTLDIDLLLDGLITEALQLVGAESGCAGLRTPEGMVCHKYFQRTEFLPLEYCWPAGHGLPGWLIQHKIPYLTNDALKDDQIVHELCEQFGVWSALSTPILDAHGEVIGFFEIHNKKDGTGFTQRDQDKLLTVANIASVAIQNTKAYEAIKHSEKALRESEKNKEFLLKLSDALRPLTDIAAIQGETSRLLGERLGADRAYYVEVNEAEDFAVVRQDYARGDLPSLAREYPLSAFRWVVPLYKLDRAVAVANLWNSDLIPEPDRAAAAAAHIAWIAVPLVKNGEVVGALCVGEGEQREWSDADVALAEEVAERIWAAMERARAETALRESEEQYRTLFNSMDEAFCVIEMIFDEQGEPVDFLYLETNPAFIKHAGQEMKGRRVLEIIPNFEKFWLDQYGRVAITGESARVEHIVEGLGDQWFETFSFRLGGEGSRQVGVLFNNITERKQAERALRESEEQYRSLFNSIDEGFCVVEMIFDDDGKPVDYRFLETNPTFKSQTGLRDAVGKRMRELEPLHEEHWFETYGRIAMTGEPERFTSEARRLGGRWFDVYASRTGEPADRRVAILFTDITERKRTEMLLSEQNRLLELIASGSSLDECLSSLCAALSQLNPGVRAAVLIADNEGKSFPRFIAPGLLPLFGGGLGGLNDALINDLGIGTCGEAMFNGESVTCADIANDERWSRECRDMCIANGIFAVHSSPIPGPGGPLGSFILFLDQPRMTNEWDLRLLVLGIDIASIAIERDRSSRIMRESEERLQRAVDVDTVGIIFFNFDGEVTEANDSFLRMSGYSRADLNEGRIRWDVLTPPEWMPRWLSTIEDLKANRQTEPYEKQYIRKDGSRRWAIFATKRLSENEVVKFIVDITARKEAEQLLEAELADSRQIGEVSTRLISQGDITVLLNEILDVAIAITRADMGNVQMASRDTGDLHIAAWRGFEQPFLDYFNSVTNDTSSACGVTLTTGQRVVVPDVEKSEIFSGNTSGEVMLKAGARAVQSTPLVSRSGQVLGAISTHWNQPHEPDERQLRLLDILARQAADLIERHESELALRRLNETLGQRVKERTVTLEELTGRLRRLVLELTNAEQRERHRIAQLIHDHLQQLLVATKMRITTAQMATNGKHSANEALADAAHLLNDAISEARSLTVQLRPPALYESGLISALRWLAGWMEETHGLKVELQLDPAAEPGIDYGAVLLFESVRELLLNVVKHAEVNECLVSLARVDRERLCLAVSDRGKGFDPTQADKQSDATGFGLFSMRERLSVMGGELNIESAPGKTVVRLLAPLSTASKEAEEHVSLPVIAEMAQGNAQPEHAANGVIRILLADDHPIVREGIANALNQAADLLVIGEATDGTAAVELAQSLRPDVVVLDVNMPSMNGIEATRAIKYRLPQVKVIGLSIHDDESMVQAMVDAGACAYVTKDAPAEELRHAVRDCAGKRAGGPIPEGRQS